MERRGTPEPSRTEPNSRRPQKKKRRSSARKPRSRNTETAVGSAETQDPGKKPTKKRAKKGSVTTKGNDEEFCLAAFVDQILQRFQERLGSEAKATVADYIRLLQLRRELEQREDDPREITVTWVDPPADGFESEA